MVSSRDRALAEGIWLEPGYWLAMCPSCTITTGSIEVAPADQNPPSMDEIAFSRQCTEELRGRLDVDGYFDLDARSSLPIGGQARYAHLVAVLGSAVRALVEHGWPATFAFVFDEAWALVAALSGAMRAATGGNELMMDVVAWHVDPAEQQAGFPPHRDRHLGSGEQDLGAVPSGFRHPGTSASPRYCTCWVALSAARADNGCLYVVPRSADPGYDHGDSSVEADTAEAAFSLQFAAVQPEGLMEAAADAATRKAVRGGGVEAEAKKKKRGTATVVYQANSETAWQHVRAVPCDPGDAVFLSHRVLHWGSRGRAASTLGPRLSLSFAASDPTFEEPYLKRPRGGGDKDGVAAQGRAMQLLPFCQRIALASAQMLCYAANSRFLLSADMAAACRAAFRAHRRVFTKTYRRKVRASWKEVLRHAPPPASFGDSRHASGRSSPESGDANGHSPNQKCTKRAKKVNPY